MDFDQAWREFGVSLNQERIKTYFDCLYSEAHAFYQEIGEPNGSREENYWEWLKEQLFFARKRTLGTKEQIVEALFSDFVDGKDKR